MTYYGIDPGVAGGVAALDEHGVVIFAGKMPETDRDIWDCLETAGGELGSRGPTRCVIERVNPGVFGRPGAKMGVVSAFTFGGGYRALKMALTGLRIPFDEVLPVKWQTIMSCRSKGDKNITKRRAQALFPGVKVTHAIADALLIAEFCRRIHGAQGYTEAPKGLFDGEEEGGKEEDHEARSDAADQRRHTEASSVEGNRREAATPATAGATARRRGRSR